MEFKSLALTAMVGASMTMGAVAPAIAANGFNAHTTTVHHPVVVPITCDECRELSNSGGFSRFTSGHSGHAITFGEANTICGGTYVGARIDVPNFRANSWAIRMTTNGEPLFVTEMLTPSGNTVFTSHVSSFNQSGDNLQVTFDGNTLGFSDDRFVSIFVYDNGGNSGISFQDSIDLTHGIQVDGIAAVPNFHFTTQDDCTGIFGNLNGTQ